MWRLKHLLSMQIALAAGLPLLVLLMVGLLIIAPQIRNQVEARHLAVATAMVGQVEGYLFSTSHELETISRLLTSAPVNRWQSILDTHVNDGEIFADILVVGSDGLSRHAGVPGNLALNRSSFLGIDLSRRKFYRQMLANGKPTWSDSYLSASSGKLTIAYALPYGNFSLVGEIELERLSRFIKRISTRDQVEIMIIDGTGALVAHPTEEQTGQQLNLRQLPIVAQGLTGQATAQEFTYQGNQLVGVTVPVKELGWIALVTQPTSIAYQSVTLSIFVLLIALGFSLIVAAAGGLVLANWVASRVNYFSENARQISTGTYGLQWPRSRILEFNTLTQRLSNMADAIQLRERELYEQRLRFEAAFETSPFAMSIVQADNGVFLEVNSTWASVTGYSASEVVGKRVSDLGIWLDINEGSKYRNRVLTEGTVRAHPTRLYRRSGEIAEVELYSSKIVINGRDYLLNIVIDVTERNRLDQQLRVTEMLQEAILNYAGHSIISTTTEGTITSFNRTAEKLLGYSADEMIGKQTPEAFHDPVEVSARAIQFSKELGQTIEPGFDVFVAHSVLGLENEYEWTYVRKDGSHFPVLLSITALQDRTGKLTGYLGLAIDITKRKMAEANLRESEQRLARQKLAIMHIAREQREAPSDDLHDLLRKATELFTFAVDVDRASIWSFDADSDAISCIDLYEARENHHSAGTTISRNDNLAYFRALEKERVVAANDALHAVETRDFAADYLEPLHIGAMLDAVILRGNELVGVVCFEHVGGPREWNTDEQNFASAMADFISLSMELYQHKQTADELRRYKEGLEELVDTRTRQLQSLNSELETFSYSVSHDLRAPLRSIDGFCQALLEDYDDNLDEVGQQYLQRVRNATQRMGLLIDDLLKLSRINKRELLRQQVDLGELSKEVVEQLVSSEPERSVEINIAPHLVATGDKGLLRVLMENLIGNAWKYTGKTDTPKIEIGAVNSGEQGIFFVRDNGAGFDMAYADKLFGAFQRLHSPKDFPGTGIGLATVSRIINRHGGRIWAEAKPNEGAVFFFTTE